MKDKVFVLPQNSVQTIEIANMLKKHGWKENEDLFISKQESAVATYGDLEPAIIDELRLRAQRFERKVSRTRGGIEFEPSLEVFTYKEMIEHGFDFKSATLMTPNFENVYGIELAGQAPCQKIGQNSAFEFDRVSSIEEVARLINVELTQEQHFIAAKERGGVEELRKYGKQLWMTDEEISLKIQELYTKEREIKARLTGITKEQEAQAIEAIEKAETLSSGCIVIELPHNEVTTVLDRIPEVRCDNDILIVTPSDIEYYGNEDVARLLNHRLKGELIQSEQGEYMWVASTEYDGIDNYNIVLENVITTIENQYEILNKYAEQWFGEQPTIEDEELTQGFGEF